MLRRASLLVLLTLLAAAPVRAQRGFPDVPAPFSLQEVMAAPFASELVAAPAGQRIAWIGYVEGRRNVWVAEGPGFGVRRLTRYLTDDGQELSNLTWTADGRSLLFVRGGARSAAGEYPNPTSDVRGTEQSVWIVPAAGGAPRRLGVGAGPVPSPAGDRVVFVMSDTIWSAPLRTTGPARVLFRARGRSAQPAWSPDGRLLAFASRRGTHGFIGVYDVRRDTIRYLAASLDRDEMPRWSPDGSRIAFVRFPGQTFAGGPGAVGTGGGAPQSPYAIWVASSASGEAHEVWRAPARPEGALPNLAGDWALFWGGDGRLLFASEMSGWLAIYGVDPAGGQAVRLTPERCEVQDVALAPDRLSFVYVSSCDDLDRLHLVRVSLSDGSSRPVTTGRGLEWRPRFLAGGRLAFLGSDARRPVAPFLLAAGDSAPARVSGWDPPSSFPSEVLVEPEPLVVRAADSVEVHLQLFLPPDGTQGRHPAMLFFHGGPIRQMLLGWHNRSYYHNAYAFNQYLASRGFVVVAVNYRGGIGYGRAFRQPPRLGRGGASEYADVLAAAAYLKSRPDVDTTRIGLWGGSYGGYLTALGLARNSDLFAAGVDLHGVHDWSQVTSSFPFARGPDVPDSVLRRMWEASPVSSVDRWRSPVLLIHGDDDRNVAFAQSVDLAQRLRRRGVSVEQLVIPDEVHSFLTHAHWLAAYRAAWEFLVTRLGTRVAGSNGRSAP